MSVSRTRCVGAAAALLCLFGGPLLGPVHGQMPAAATAVAAASTKRLPDGVSLLPSKALAAFQVTGAKDGVEMQTVPVSGQPFAEALRLRTKTKPALEYSFQLVATPIAPVRKGDVLLATFHVRAVEGGQAETGEARTQFVFERAAAPHTKSATLDVAIPRGQWRRIDVPFVAAEDGAAGQTHISFRLGYAPQVIEIGGITVVNYEKKVALNDLPRTRSTYAGREPDAPWRGEAQARIEKIRKASLTVLVTDNSGKPVPNAAVTVRMQKHTFPFGSAVAADMLLGDSSDRRRYQEMVPRLFNRVVMENDLKWPQWEADPQRAKQGVAWLRERGIEVRGHNLVWPSWRYSPKDLQALKNDKAALAKRVRDHITNEVGALRGQIVEWDVVNEPYSNHDLLDILGNEAMVDWFKLAHSTDPAPLLFLNDYPPLDGAATDNPHLNNFEKNLRFLLDSGAPLSGIGFQCHFGGSVIPPARLLSGLDRFAKLGLPIAVTEFDINTTDQQLQADYLRDFLTAMFSHPSVNSVVMWGFWEGRHWKPDAALWRKDWSIKPSGQAWLDLVQKTWWTNADGATDDKGVYQTRGFLGDYTVMVRAGGKSKTVRANLAAGGAKLTVTLE